MNREPEPWADHTGEILRKARALRGMDLKEAADLAGVSPAAYEELENQWRAGSGLNLDQLWSRLGCHAPAVSLGGEEHTERPELSNWREIRRFTTRQEEITVHHYLVWDEISREAALFDTGWSALETVQLARAENLNLRFVFLTHTHADHMEGLDQVRTAFPKVRLRSSSPHAPPDQRNRPDDFSQLGNLRISCRPAPGHSEDSAVYIIGGFPDDAPHAIMTGDALFAGSIGFPHHSPARALEAVREILSLPESSLVCPGHGPLTTVGRERARNPFSRMAGLG